MVSSYSAVARAVSPKAFYSRTATMGACLLLVLVLGLLITNACFSPRTCECESVGCVSVFASVCMSEEAMDGWMAGDDCYISSLPVLSDWVTFTRLLAYYSYILTAAVPRRPG